MSETSMAAPLGGTDEGPEAPTTYVGDLNGGGGGALGGADEGPGAPTTYVEDINGGPPVRH
jgi:hypothetical protein